MASCTLFTPSNSNSEHAHKFGEWLTIENATCAKAGVKVRYCSCGEKQNESIPKLPHDVVIDEGVSPTCTEAGLTKGKHCSVCNEVIVAQTVANALGHTYVYGDCTRCEANDTNYIKTYVRCDKDGTLNENGDYILFGEYPQTIKADDVTVTSTQDSRGYYLGSDGFYYAKIIANPFESSYTFSTGATILSGTAYYFKVEPIRWRILDEENGAAFILCDSIITNQKFDDDSNNYAESEIRQWLNETFYVTAFTQFQQEIILTTTVDNSVYSTGYSSNPYACENTEDKVFLLSYSDVTNSEYGFSRSQHADDAARQMQTSDYSRAMEVVMSTSLDYYGNGHWWTRSSNGDRTYLARYIHNEGIIINTTVSFTLGVVPALQIRL